MIIEKLDKTAAQIYQAQEDYQRFNQMYNLMVQRYWNEKAIKIEQRRKENLEKYVKENRPGYSRLDFAFLQGPAKYLEKLEYEINICDRAGNRWRGSKGTKISADLADKEILTKAIKRAAKIYGASTWGIAKMDRRWIFSHWFDPQSQKSYPIVFSDEDKKYSHIDEPLLLENKVRVIPAAMENVIVLAFEMDNELLKYSPSLLAYGEGVNIYGKMSLATINLAEFIRSLGYNAIPSINCTGLNIPLAIDAGLGQIGRNGKLITPQYGPRVRICKVITDLPLIPDKPINFGVTEFCDACRKCVRECPAGAIPSGSRSRGSQEEVSNGGYLRWMVDHKKCFQYWSQCGTNCNICLYVCSYNRGYKWTKSILDYTRSNALVDTLLDALDDNYCNSDPNIKLDNFWAKD